MIKKTYVFDGFTYSGMKAGHARPRRDFSVSEDEVWIGGVGLMRREHVESPRRARPGGDVRAYDRLNIMARERIAAGEATDTYDALSQIEIEGKHDALIASAFALRPKREMGRGLMLPPGQSIADVYESRFADLKAKHPDLGDGEIHDMVAYS